MLLFTLEDSVVVIDLTIFKVTQVLDCKLLEVSKYIRWSEYKNTLDFIYFDSKDSRVLYISIYVVSCGNTLKELALDFIVDKVSNEKIQNANLLCSLVQEIMRRKEHWVIFGTMSSSELIKLENFFKNLERTIEKCSRCIYV